MAIAGRETPWITAYPFSLGAGFGTRYADPAPLPPLGGSANARGVGFTDTGDAVALAHDSYGNISGTVWAWNSTTGFGTKFANPGSSIMDDTRDVEFSRASNAVVFGGNLNPRITAYAWSPSGFGSKYVDPASGSRPPAAVTRVKFASDDSVVAASHLTSPYIAAYPWSSSTGFGSKYASPASLPPDDGNDVTFSQAVDAVALMTQRYFTSSVIYQWSPAGFGTQYATPGGSWVSNTGEGVDFAAKDSAIGIAQSNSPYVVGYPWDSSTGLGTKYANPSTVLTVGTRSAQFI